jgi:hypothetical protein
MKTRKKDRTNRPANRPSRVGRRVVHAFGFLGVGWIGRRRLEALVEEGAAEVVAIADPSAENLAKCAEIVPDAGALQRAERLLETSLDGLVISTPSALHAEQTIAAPRTRPRGFLPETAGTRYGGSAGQSWRVRAGPIGCSASISPIATLLVFKRSAS